MQIKLKTYSIFRSISFLAIVKNMKKISLPILPKITLLVKTEKKLWNQQIKVVKILYLMLVLINTFVNLVINKSLQLPLLPIADLTITILTWDKFD